MHTPFARVYFGLILPALALPTIAFCGAVQLELKNHTADEAMKYFDVAESDIMVGSKKATELKDRLTCQRDVTRLTCRNLYSGHSNKSLCRAFVVGTAYGVMYTLEREEPLDTSYLEIKVTCAGSAWTLTGSRLKTTLLETMEYNSTELSKRTWMP